MAQNYDCRGQKITAGAFVLCAKMLAKSTNDFDLTNILQAAFTLADPESAKKIDGMAVLFVLLEFKHIKASRQNIGEIDPKKRSVFGTFQMSERFENLLVFGSALICTNCQFFGT